MSVPFALKQRSTVSCLARGACFLYPQARTVLDAGAESSTAIRLSADGTVEDAAGNDKCAAGAGVFLDTMSRMLRIPLAELGAESLKATNAETISSTCAVFAESEVVSLVHGDPPVPIRNILAGIHNAMASKIVTLAMRVGLAPDYAVTGGGAMDIGLVNSIGAELGTKPFVPAHPQTTAALGAALLALDFVALRFQRDDHLANHLTLADDGTSDHRLQLTDAGAGQFQWRVTHVIHCLVPFTRKK